ncbi:MAG: hypothetical protein M1820_007238 [Bogoriella megaspora]|nr:MAG: hypothetical protein M1820_007238 [Bogoriella megaspora]
MPGLIAMISVFIVVGIEMFFAMHGAGHVHGGEYDSVKNKDPGNGNASYQNKNYNGNKRLSHHRQESYNRYRQEVQIDNGEEAEFGINGQTPEIAMRNFAPGSSNSRPAEEEEAFDRGDFTPPSSSRLSPRPPDEEQYPISPFLEEEGASTHLLPRSKSPHPSRPTSPNNPDLDHNHDHPQTPPMNPQKALLQCLLLEAGILFHSIFIGMALSVSVGPPFLVLLLAISFHQTFEGLALGSRISALIASPRPKKSTSNSTSPSSNINPTTAPIFESTSLKPWLMALAYGTTTPIGQAIGLAVHRLYDPNSEVGLLTVGIMNAVSSGLLLFAGLVELLAEDFLSDRSYETLRGRRRIEACAAVVAGGGLMALVGAWA